MAVPARLASRMAVELKQLGRQPPPGISAWPKGDVTTQLDVQLQGPADTPYELGLFKLTVVIPTRYPMEPPAVQFVTPVYHPNIDSHGRICLNYLNLKPKGNWSPAMDLCKVLAAVRQLLAEPNPRDPLMPDIAEEYVSQPEVFRSRARRHVAAHARPINVTAEAHASKHSECSEPEQDTNDKQQDELLQS